MLTEPCHTLALPPKTSDGLLDRLHPKLAPLNLRPSSHFIVARLRPSPAFLAEYLVTLCTPGVHDRALLLARRISELSAEDARIHIMVVVDVHDLQAMSAISLALPGHEASIASLLRCFGCARASSGWALWLRRVERDRAVGCGGGVVRRRRVRSGQFCRGLCLEWLGRETERG